MSKLKDLASLSGTVKAGVLEGARGAGGKAVLDYAPIQEFGGRIPVTEKMRGFLAVNYGIHLREETRAITIPPRPFLRTTVQQQGKKWINRVKTYLSAGYTADQVLHFVGGEMKADIIDTIKSSMPPPNSEATTMIKQKVAPAAVGKTLMHTGTLVHSIKYEVTA